MYVRSNCQRLALLAALSLSLTTVPAVRAQQPPSGGQGKAQVSQQEACSKLARRLQRVQTNQGVQAAIAIYHKRIEKLQSAYGPRPCPSVQQPQTGPNIK